VPNFRFVDLFAGVGGFHYALADEKFGGQCVLAVEIDEECRRVYSVAFPETPQVADIRSLTRLGTGEDAPLEVIAARVPDHDVLCAGFPCQPFSKSGGQLGILDQTRGTLFFDIMAIVRAKRPRFLLLENVPNLVGPRHRDTWRTIVAAIREAGYGVTTGPVILSPHRLPPPLGAPQVRERVFILAIRGDTSLDFASPLIPKRPYPSWVPTRSNLVDYLDPDEAGAEYRLRSVEVTWLNAWDAFLRLIPDDKLPGFPIWVDAWRDRAQFDDSTPTWKVEILKKNSAFYVEHRAVLDSWLESTWDDEGTTVRNFPPSRRKFEWQARSAHPGRSGRTLWDLLIHIRPSGIRVKAPTYFPALVAIAQTPIIGWLRRRMTPAEGARLQGLDYRAFKDAGVDDPTVYRQLGNAVNVGVVQFVAASMFAQEGEDWGSGVSRQMLRLIA
jgi:DNA (cytosine-5)-methyltransferase 1